MGLLAYHHPFLLLTGILGNIFSLVVYIAPVQIFWRIYINKTIEQFQATPYVVALMNALLWIYYSVLTGSYALLTINVVGAVLRMVYILVFVYYADRSRKIQVAILTAVLNIILFPGILFVTLFLTKGSLRITILGWMGVAAATSAFAAPLAIIRQVIRTRSVEFMPFCLSLFLTLSAAMWTAYGLFREDIHITIPSALGFAFGVIQLLLYAIYRGVGEAQPTNVEL